MHSLLILSEKASPRLNYVCRLIFMRHLGLRFTITTDSQVFKEHTGAKINYAKQPQKEEIYINPSALLFETGIREQTITTGQFRGITVPFFGGEGTLPFDVFAAVFYVTSRYEEYLPFTPNQYGQFKATDSLAYKLGFLAKPVVDIWIADLKQLLAAKYPLLVFGKKEFASTFTYDIDVAYAYKGRPLVITLLNVLKDLCRFNVAALKKRVSVLNGNMNDPFDTYGHIAEIKAKYQHNVLYFFLLGPKNNTTAT